MPAWAQIAEMNRSNSEKLAARGEEGLEEGSGFRGQDGWGDFDLVVEFGTGEQFKAGAEGAAFWVVGRVDQAGDAGLDDGASAHGAGFEGYVKSGFRKAVVAEIARGFPKHHDFCVRGRVAIADGAIAAASENFTAIDKDSADGNFAGFGTGPGFFQRDLHEFGIVHRGVVENITLVRPPNGLPSLLGSLKARILDIRGLAKETVNRKVLIGRLIQVEMAYYSREGAIWDRHRLEEGPTPTRHTR
jgi:hypothetical protein